MYFTKKFTPTYYSSLYKRVTLSYFQKNITLRVWTKRYVTREDKVWGFIKCISTMVGRNHGRNFKCRIDRSYCWNHQTRSRTRTEFNKAPFHFASILDFWKIREIRDGTTRNVKISNLNIRTLKDISDLKFFEWIWYIFSYFSIYINRIYTYLYYSFIYTIIKLLIFDAKLLTIWVWILLLLDI